MLTKLIIYRQGENIYSFAYSGNKLIFCLSDNANYFSEAVFIGCIKRLNKANQTAFVEYSTASEGFVNLAANSRLQEGSCLPLQLSWRGNASKLAKLRLGWQLVGKYVVYVSAATSGIKAKGFSVESLAQLEEYAQRYPGQWIIRSCVNRLSDLNLVALEMEQLLAISTVILAARQVGLCFAGVPNYLKILRSLPLAADCEVISNDREINQSLINLYQELWQIDAISYDPRLEAGGLIAGYQSELANPLVKLANGAALEIYTLAGLNIIDVNSDKLQIKADSLNFIVLDAIYQQICLRNLQGIILIDFVKNMSESGQAKIISYLQKIFKIELSNTQVLGFTKAGLCELIRTKF